MIKEYGALIALGAGVVLVLGYFAKKGVVAAAEVASVKLNPLNSQNVVYDNVIGGVGKALSQDAGWSLGGWVYDVLH